MMAALLAGWVADRALGDPRRGHPVAGFGRLAACLERALWRDDRLAGAVYAGILVGGPAAAVWAIQRRLDPRRRAVLLALVTWAALGSRSLGREAAGVADAVARGDLDDARSRLPALCGRDPSSLDAGELCRATVESVAENTADAVVGPLLWGRIAGPAGVVAHRCVNTLDAMVGHRCPRYERFGWASARLDDLVNWVPARMTALLAAGCAPLVGGSPRGAMGVLRRDGAAHPSPNAGRCEAAFAGALGVRLGGVNRYGDRVEVRGPFGDGTAPAPADVRRAIRLSTAVGLAAVPLSPFLHIRRKGAVNGGLLVAGTASDAGKTVVVAGICRWLARQGVKVAPFKAQNMALNSFVTVDGAEVGRAQAMQAAAAGVEPEAAMNPVLLKPTGERTSQVIVMGQPVGTEDARTYQQRKPALLEVALRALEDLRARYDVVICEGAGSPAEINLRAGDFVNMGLARAAGLPTVVVGDIDRGGVFAALYGTLALLDPEDRALIGGFLINKFRGDPDLLAPGLARLEQLTGRPVLGVLPWREGLWLDVEDSLALESRPVPTGAGLDVAVVRLPRMSNFTDLDALAAEPGVRVRFTTDATDVARADLVVLPGTKATVADLALVRAWGVDGALAARARRGDPVLGICGGYQMLGRTITDDVESCAGVVEGLGLLPVETAFEPEKVLARRAGTCPLLGDTPATGYEIRHGRVTVHGGAPLLDPDEGCADGTVLGTSWHGLLEGDELRRALLSWVAERRGLDFVPAETEFAAVREARLDALGDLVADHTDLDALEDLIDHGTSS